MRSASRATAGGMVLSALMVFSASCTHTTKQPQGYWGPTKSLNEVVAQVNANNSAIPTLYARQEIQSGRPIIGIAQTGGDLTPCNRIHMTPVERVKAGIRDAGGVPFEFPVHPIQESCRRPTAALDRNLAFLGIVEVLCGYPLDGVVLLTGCDKTTPACLMAVATVNLPAIALTGFYALSISLFGDLDAGRGGADHGRPPAARAVEASVLPLVAAGRVRVPVAATFPLAEGPAAYERFAAGGKLGKIVLLT